MFVDAAFMSHSSREPIQNEVFGGEEHRFRTISVRGQARRCRRGNELVLKELGCTLI